MLPERTCHLAAALWLGPALLLVSAIGVLGDQPLVSGLMDG